MEYRRLGRTGLKVSAICLGTMQFGWTAVKEASLAVMDTAVAQGINFFDTADVYSNWAQDNPGGVSEQIIGEWLAGRRIPRDQIIIATKVRGEMGSGPNDQGLSRHHILHAVEASLRRLQTDYIDLYQMHWYDEETPLDETLRALDDLVRAGKVRYVGCSNYPAWLLMKSLWISDVQRLVRFDSLQPHYNLLHRAEFERELMPLCLDQGVGVIPYGPLGGGFLTGKYRRNTPLPDSARAAGVQRRYLNERGFAVVDKLEEIAQAHEATIAQVAIAWVLANTAVTAAIIGANSSQQLLDILGGERIQLTAVEKEVLDTLTAWEKA
ncbi:MAG: aldo/keto reductase [Chloroflexi bacterium]|nr:aldo/keto reductase [Ardenticatenaceae bacterium]MBL1131173.1 aldo/keto reductase [Chloroflexota bacterium]NOG37272.1 aldo/keto reductase [Chloroflexota bacterium]